MDDAVVEGDAIMGDYRLGATLGVGSSAVVREGVDERSGERLAIKIVDKSRAARYKIVRRLNNEVVHMRAVEHPNVARLVDVVHARAGLYLVLEHGGRDLYGYPARRGLLRCPRGAVHHAKSENVLVAPGVEDGQVAAVRLTDLGMSETYEPGQRGTAFCGSPGFFPPEMVAAADYDPFKVDAWSIGCVALELLLGRQWFSDRWLPASAWRVIFFSKDGRGVDQGARPEDLVDVSDAPRDAKRLEDRRGPRANDRRSSSDIASIDLI
ncbi:protein kinase [Aureococcus anophagefferens]|nr:protein kinase [Aureococcus anophagefferens]